MKPGDILYHRITGYSRPWIVRKIKAGVVTLENLDDVQQVYTNAEFDETAT